MNSETTRIRSVHNGASTLKHNGVSQKVTQVWLQAQSNTYSLVSKGLTPNPFLGISHLLLGIIVQAFF